MSLSKSVWKRFLPVLLLLPLLLGVVAFSLFWGYQDKSRVKPTPASTIIPYLRQAPSFELVDPDGKKHTLEEFRGSLTFLHFWASWCAPCLDEIPHWRSLGTRFKGRSAKFVAISLDQNWIDALKIFPAPEKSLDSLISLLDPTTQVAELYGSFQYPETYLLSPDLKVITKWVGPQDWNDPKMLELIDRMIRNYH